VHFRGLAAERSGCNGDPRLVSMLQEFSDG
jgi:hypothetical protein